jgi:erythronate-4-phosphate dehydrogenase
MARMLVVADSNIPYAEEAFGHFGEVRLVRGRGLTAEQVVGADVLLLRSTVRIDGALLAGCEPKFVGTATIGTDHVDREYLSSRNIPFASAPGSNAESVAEYWSCAVLLVAALHGWDLAGRTAGVVGAGNVGSRVARRARALGMEVLECDPPLARRTGSDQYRPLEELLAASDVLTLHVPLNRGGPDATLGMAGEGFFRKLKPGAVFVNTSRGKVHSSSALGAAIDSGRLTAAVLDVWEHEPRVDLDLLQRVEVATPHIAGHSLDGKVAGTYMLYRAACRALDADERWKPEDSLPAAETPRLELDGAVFDSQLTATEAALSVYPIAEDDRRMRRSLTIPEEERAAHFTSMRVDYPVRRAFRNTSVNLSGGGPEHRRALAGLGFQVAQA